MSTVRRRPYRRRRRGPAVVFFLLLALLGVALFVTGGFATVEDRGGGGSDATADGGSGGAGAVAGAGSSDLDSLLAGAQRNGDGSVTVALSDAQTSSLLAQAVAQSQTQQLRDVSARAVTPDSGAAGQLELSGRLEQLPVPVNATVDLDVADQRVIPTLRDVRVGPVAVSDDMRRDLTAQIRQLALVADDDLAVDAVTTTNGELRITGRPR